MVVNSDDFTNTTELKEYRVEWKFSGERPVNKTMFFVSLTELMRRLNSTYSVSIKNCTVLVIHQILKNGSVAILLEHDEDNEPVVSTTKKVPWSTAESTDSYWDVYGGSGQGDYSEYYASFLDEEEALVDSLNASLLGATSSTSTALVPVVAAETPAIEKEERAKRPPKNRRVA